MSLQDFIMQRAALQHQNMLNSDTAGIVLGSLAQGVLQGIQQQQADMQERKRIEAQNKRAIDMYKGLGKTTDDVVGTLIPSLKMKDDGNFEFTARTSTPAEEKSIYELNTEKQFIKDIQSGSDANTLRLKYPTKSSDIDQLQKAGTVRSGGIKDTVKLDSTFVDVTPPTSVEGEIQSDGVKFVPKGFDELGRITGYERVDASESEKKRQLEVSELDSSIKNLISSFALADKEAKQVSNQGKSGLEGRIAGKITTLKGMIGESPAVNVYRMRAKAFATTVAKAAGEVRPTDEDIRRFVSTLMSTELSDEENKLLMDGLINDLRARGAKAVWSERGGFNGETPVQPMKKQVGRFTIEVE